MSLFQTVVLTIVLALPAVTPVLANNLSNTVDTQVPFTKQKCDSTKVIATTGVIQDGVDGDTFRVKTKTGNYSVRMLGIDTPETHYQGQSQGEWAEKASARMKELLPAGTKVKMEFAPEVCDHFGRVLAHVFKGKTHINKQMVKEGLAVNYCIYPSTAYCEELGEQTGEAIAERRGMFSDPNMELPYDFRRRLRGGAYTYFVGSLQSKEVYHPGPQQERIPVSDRIFFSKEESVVPPYELMD